MPPRAPQPDLVAADGARPQVLFRTAFTVVGSAPFLVAAILQLVRGWRPTSDDAVITFRAWATFSAHAALVGQPTLVLPSGLTAHDLGPLEYWLLAVPVHLDPAQGSLLGAALLCTAATALAINAVWSVRGFPAAVGLVAILGIMVVERPGIVLDPVWNPNLGLVSFLAVGALAWAVATGRFGYWPWLVLTASLAAQCHSIFALGSAAACVVALVLGVLGRRRWSWWMAGGVAVGIGCWLGPIVQQLTSGRHGNMSLLLRMSGGPHALGFAFGLRALASVVSPGPTWLHGSQLDNVLWLVHTISSRPLAVGIGALVVAVAGAAWAWRTGRRQQATLWAVVAVMGFSVAVTVGSYPIPSFAELVALNYVVTVTWPVGLAFLAALAWTVVDAAALFVRRKAAGPAHRAEAHMAKRLLTPAAACFLVAATFPIAWSIHNEIRDNPSAWTSVASVRAAVSEVQARVPKGPITVLQGGVGAGLSSLDEYSVVLGVLWGLYGAGYHPVTIAFYEQLIGWQVGSIPPAVEVAHGPTIVVSSSGPSTVLDNGSTPVPH